MPPAGNRPSMSALSCLLIVLVSGLVVMIGVLDPPFRPLPISKSLILFLTSCLLGFFLICCGDLVWQAVRTFLTGRKNESSRRRAILAGGVALALALVLVFIGQAAFQRQLLALEPGPVELAAHKAHELSAWFGESEKNRLDQIARLSGQGAGKLETPQSHETLVMRAIAIGADAAWTLDANGKVHTGRALVRGTGENTTVTLQTEPLLPEKRGEVSAALELWEVDGKNFLVRRAPVGGSEIAVARRFEGDLPGLFGAIETTADELAADRQSFIRPQAARVVLLQIAVAFLVLLGVAHSDSLWPSGALFKAIVEGGSSDEEYGEDQGVRPYDEDPE